MKIRVLFRHWMVILTLILVISACASPPPAAGLNKPAPESSPTSAPQSSASLPSAALSPTSPPVAVPPTGTAGNITRQVEGCSQALLPDSVLLVTWNRRSQENAIAPTDPQTGQPLCEFKQINAGKQYFSALSPDGKTLALTISHRDDGGGARLHLLDLENWQLAETPVEFDRWVGLLAFSPDGRQLAVASSGPAYGAQGMLFSTQLASIDLSNQSVLAETLLDFNPRLLAYLPDGSALVLYGSAQTQDYLAQGDPTAVMLDVSTLQEIWQTSLPGILEGQFKDGEIEGPEGFINWSPGLAFSTASQTLFVVHADSDRLTTVDFSKRTLGTVEISRAASWLERLLALTAGVAHAKTLNGTMKTSILSPDGERLYVVGLTGDSWQDSYGEWQFEEQMLGLQVIDPAGGAVLAHLEVDSSDLALSPDGTQIYLRGWNNAAAWTEVVDAHSLKPIARLTGRYLVNGRALSGEPLLLSNVSHEHQTSLSVLDRTSFAEVSKWWVRGYANWLILP